MNPVKRAAITGVCFVLVCAFAFFGWKAFRERRMTNEILAVLRMPNRVAQIQEFGRIKQEHQEEAAYALIGLLDDPDAHIRAGVCRGLSLVRGLHGLDSPDAEAEVAKQLARQLRSNSDPVVRLGCAITLMGSDEPVVRDAYLSATRDSSGKVVQLACGEVARRGGAGAKDALNYVLDHGSWHERLEAAKGLIVGRYADDKTVSVLEKMSQESEAIAFDKQADEFEEVDRKVGFSPGESWGKLASITEQARNVAAGRDRHSK